MNSYFGYTASNELSGNTINTINNIPAANWNNITLLNQGLSTTSSVQFSKIGIGKAAGTPNLDVLGDVSITGNVIAFGNNYLNRDSFSNTELGKRAIGEWTQHASVNNTNQWGAICYSRPLNAFVAVSATGTNRIMYSVDGTTWISIGTAYDAFSWQGVCYSESLGLFVAVATTGTGKKFITSMDGINWTQRVSPNNSLEYRAIVYSEEQGLFVATSKGDNAFCYSSDGINWTLVPTPGNLITWLSICYSKKLNLFCAVGLAGSNPSRVGISNNGIDWNYYDAANTSIAWGCVVYSEELGLFVATSYTNSVNCLMTSDDGMNWVGRSTQPETPGLWAVTWAKELGIFVGTGTSSGTKKIAISNNGIDWTSYTSANDTFGWRSICYADSLGIFVAVASSGTGDRTMRSRSIYDKKIRTLTGKIGINKIATTEALEVAGNIQTTGNYLIAPNREIQTIFTGNTQATGHRITPGAFIGCNWFLYNQSAALYAFKVEMNTSGNKVGINLPSGSATESLEVVGNIKSTALVKCETPLVSRWETIVISPFNTNVGPGTKIPAVSLFKDNSLGSRGVYTYAFDDVKEEELFFHVQMPHSYLEGSDIKPHVHFSIGVPNATVGWVLEYIWCNSGSAFGNTSLISETKITDASNAYTHEVCGLGSITGTGKKISSILSCRLWRLPGGTPSLAYLLSIDFHIQINTIGSESELSKGNIL